MANRLAAHKDPRIIASVQGWWQEYQRLHALTRTPRTFGDLFTSYTRQQLDDYDIHSILTVHQFMRAIAAIGVSEIAPGHWRSTSYTPSPSTLGHITAPIPPLSPVAPLPEVS